MFFGERVGLDPARDFLAADAYVTQIITAAKKGDREIVEILIKEYAEKHFRLGRNSLAQEVAKLVKAA